MLLTCGVHRRQHDKAYKRWPPHVNLVYPFVPRPELPEAAAALAVGLDQGHFSLRFVKCGFFEHSKKSFTLYLEPSESAELQQLYEASTACFPTLPTPSRAFVPHLTLGQFSSRDAVLQAKKHFENQMTAYECELSELVLIARDGNEPFTPRYGVEFSNSSFNKSAATLWDGTLIQPGGMQNPFGFSSAAAQQESAHQPRCSLTVGPDIAAEGHLAIQLPELSLPSATDEPLNVVLCLDRSGSMAGTPWRQVQEVVLRLGEIAKESAHVQLV